MVTGGSRNVVLTDHQKTHLYGSPVEVESKYWAENIVDYLLYLLTPYWSVIDKLDILPLPIQCGLSILYSCIYVQREWLLIDISYWYLFIAISYW